LVHRRVNFPAVRALGDHEIERPGRRLRIAEDRRVVPADVRGEEQPLRPVASARVPLIPLEYDVGGAEDVARVVERERHAVADLRLHFVIDALPEFQHGGGVGRAIERLDRLFARGAPAAIQIRGVLLLDLRRVHQHDARDLGGGRRDEDRAVEPVADEDRQPAAVIEVAVREDDGVDRAKIVRQVLVDPPGLLARSLVQAEVEQNAEAVHFQEVTRPGDGAIGAAELDAHGQRD
jgi:hypothetical protein